MFGTIISIMSPGYSFIATLHVYVLHFSSLAWMLLHHQHLHLSESLVWVVVASSCCALILAKLSYSSTSSLSFSEASDAYLYAYKAANCSRLAFASVKSLTRFASSASLYILASYSAYKRSFSAVSAANLSCSA